MSITTYQIRNVLRIYGNQLKRRGNLMENGFDSAQHSSDFVDISVEARRKQMLTQLSRRLISKLSPKGQQQRNYEIGGIAHLQPNVLGKADGE